MWDVFLLVRVYVFGYFVVSMVLWCWLVLLEVFCSVVF